MAQPAWGTMLSLEEAVNEMGIVLPMHRHAATDVKVTL